jgi:hypothetical protein
MRRLCHGSAIGSDHGIGALDLGIARGLIHEATLALGIHMGEQAARRQGCLGLPGTIAVVLALLFLLQLVGLGLGCFLLLLLRFCSSSPLSTPAGATGLAAPTSGTAEGAAGLAPPGLRKIFLAGISAGGARSLNTLRP